jgi:hypothetical protein
MTTEHHHPSIRRKRQENGNWACAAHRAGVHQPDFHGEIIAELERLHNGGTVRVIDSLAVTKTPAASWK